MQRPSVTGRAPSVSRRQVWAPLVALCCLAAVLPARAEEYRIGLGDVLEVQILGEPELSVPPPGLTTGPDGAIVLPFVGPVPAAGSTCEEIAERIRAALIEKEILLDPSVMVRVREYHAQTYNVLGAVHAPGSYPFRPGLTLRDAIAAAGGLVEAGDGAASRTSARLVRSDGQAVPIPLLEVLTGETGLAAVTLEPGDTLLIDRRGTVAVIGQVTAPGVIEVDGEAPLSEIIARSGGVTAAGDLDRVSLRRSDGTSEEVALRTLAAGAAQGPAVRPGDTVYVPEIRHANVIGFVANPGPYPVRAETRVSDLVSAAGGPSSGGTSVAGAHWSRGDLSRVVLTRRGGASLTLDLAAVLLRGETLPELDPLVGPGDSVFVPEERLEVAVLGHVGAPGRYGLRPGDRITDALALAGGPLRPTAIPSAETAADLAHCVLHRVDGKSVSLDLQRLLDQPSAPDNLVLQQGDTLFVPEADNRVMVAGYVTTPGYFAYRPGDTVRAAVAMAGGVLANVGSQNAVTVRHADGAEVVLDLAAGDQPLASGDLITVPFARLRVAVLGWVVHPGVFEWHEGDTVADMLAQAGGPVIENGDKYRAILIRRTKGAAAGEAGAPRPVDVLTSIGSEPRPEGGRTTRGDYEVVDLGRFYNKGQLAGNPPVRPDDIIFVPKSDHTNYAQWLGNIESGLVIWNLLRGIF